MNIELASTPRSHHRTAKSHFISLLTRLQAQPKAQYSNKYNSREKSSIFHLIILLLAVSDGKRIKFYNLLNPLSANSHSSVKRRRRKSLPARRASISSDKGPIAKDEETETLPDVQEGNEGKQHYGGVDEGTEIRGGGGWCVMLTFS